MKNTKEKHIKQIIKKPNRIVYFLGCMVAKIVLKLVFKRTIINNLPKDFDSNFIVLSHHSGALDVAFMFSALYPKKINLVTGRDVFTNKKMSFIIKGLQFICKNQFALDISSIRMIKNAVDSGCNIGLYPEGKLSIDGKNLHYLSPSIVKFIKFLNVPVVFTNIYGSYPAKPRYLNEARPGKITQTIDLLLSKEDLTTLSNDEIYDKVKNAMTYNELEYQVSNNLRFKTKCPAKNVNMILYKCPKCEAEYENYSTNTQLICKKCGNTVTFDEYGNILIENDNVGFKRIDLWYDYQRKCALEQISKDDFYISKKVTVKASTDNSPYLNIGEGELYIDKVNIGFKGLLNGKEIELKSPLKTTFTLIVKNDESIDLTFNTTIYRFKIIEDKYAFLYGIIVEESFKKINSL